MVLSKPFKTSTTTTITAGTTGTVTLTLMDIFVAVKTINITTGATIVSITVNGVDLPVANTIDLTAEFGDMVYVEDIVVSIDNTAGTVDDNPVVEAVGIQKVRI